MTELRKLILYDTNGNPVDVHLSADGGYSLATTVEQNVVEDTNNSSTSNLASAATFTGTATSTLGVVGLQWSLKTDQNCTVYIEESPDGTKSTKNRNNNCISISIHCKITQ